MQWGARSLHGDVGTQPQKVFQFHVAVQRGVPLNSTRDDGANGSLRLTCGLGCSTHRTKFKMEQKEEPSRPKWNQQGTKRVPTDTTVAPKSCFGAFEVLGFLH